MSERELLILNWLDLQPNGLQPIINDASQRKYYRYSLNGGSYIVMDSAQDPSLPQFIKIAKQMFAWGLCVPEIYKIEAQQGLITMSDLGNDLYLNKLNPQIATQLYQSALKALLVMQKNMPPNEWSLTTMERSYIQNKLNVFTTWFLQTHLQVEITAAISRLLQELENLFVAIFAAQPQVLVHLDYHSRNLLILPDGNTGILDFQDAMIGPLTYDVVSLLQDAYISWPRVQIEKWLAEYQTMAIAAGIIRASNHQQFVRYFDLVGLQRHLKNLGVFARLHHRDNKSKYLHDMPMLLKYILDTCRRYQELQGLLEFFEQYVLPTQ